MNKLTEPVRSIVEWEGRINHVAWERPYAFIIGTSRIDIRDVNTGRLCQTVKGNMRGLRCLWDGRTSNQWGAEETKGSGGPYVQFALDGMDGKTAIFELVPVLYPSSSLSS